MHGHGVALLSISNFCCHQKGQNFTTQKYLHVISHSFLFVFFILLDPERSLKIFPLLLKGLLANKNRSCDFSSIEKKSFWVRL